MTAEDLLGMIVLSAARDAVIMNFLLGRAAPIGYYYLYGAIVPHAKSPTWLPGLWNANPSTPPAPTATVKR